MLTVDNLTVQVADQKILNGLSLQVKPGEVHAIMGPNGSGKSTLTHALAGRSGYEVTDGSVIFNDDSLLDLSIDERALRGLFVSFQHPVELPGVNNSSFLRMSVNKTRLQQGLAPLSPSAFLKEARAVLASLGMPDEFLKRSLNVGFSGGEKKYNEVLQLLMHKPALSILDELDSGLDIDALKKIGEGVNSLRSSDRSFIIVTHFPRILHYIQPDYVHVLMDGKIVHSGLYDLAWRLEKEGYGFIKDMQGVS